MGGFKYMVGWPAGRPDFLQKRAAGRVGWIDPGSRFFWKKSGRPAGQPTLYLDPPIHFGGIFIGLGILLDVFSLLWGYFPYYGGYFPYYEKYFPYSEGYFPYYEGYCIGTIRTRANPVLRYLIPLIEIHGGEPKYMVGNPYMVGSREALRGLPWPPKAGRLAGQATMYVGSPPCMGFPPCIWIPHHVFRSMVSGI